ncbi:hypothetical protein VE03_07596 [Pseudogymnoascus sp. 23342-1-I1]|nr:hypothetical protein VE03_07596 [Pseudogymnoascus sp. 23342-1-I1]
MVDTVGVVSFASSILQLVDFGTKVVKQLHEFLHCVDEIPGSLRDITLELPLLIEVLQQLKHHVDHGYYRPQVESILRPIINACSVEIASLEVILLKSLPKQQDSKKLRCLKAAYSLRHEKETVEINSRLSGYIAKLVLFQSLLAPDYIIHTIRENLETIAKDELHHQPSLRAITQEVKRERDRARNGCMSNYNYRKRRFSTSFSFAQLGLLWRLQTSITMSWGNGAYSIAPELQLERLVKFTSPGFQILWSCEQGYIRWSTAEKELEKLFRIGQASPLDTDTRGGTWIEKVLYLPLLGRGNCEERMSFLEMLFKWGVKLNGNTSIERDPFLLKFLCQCSKRACGFWGQTPLMDAILSGSREEIISCLWDARAVLGRNSLGQTAVHLAVIRSIELARLLDAGGELNAPDCRGIMPLEYAAVYGCADSVIILLEAGAQTTSEDKNGSLHIIFLEYATQLAHWDVVKKAIPFLRASPYYDDRFIDDELNHLMAKHLQVSDRAESSLNGITLLLELGADLNMIMEDGDTLLHISRGADEVKFLLQAGIMHLDHPNNEGTSPLMSAVQSSDQRYRAILKIGCNVNHQDQRGRSALHLAVDHWVPEVYYHENKLQSLDQISNKILMIKTLLNHNSDPLIRDNCRCPCSSKGCSPSSLLARLELRCSQGNYWLLEWLLILKEQMDTGITQQALLDIIRVKKFNKLGMTHTCCSQRTSPPFDISTNKDNAEVSDREKDLIQKLEDFMGCVSKSPLNTVDNWIKLLSQFFYSDWEESGYSWCLGVWKGGSMSLDIGGTTPPFYSPFEIKELGISGEPNLGEKINYRSYIHEPSDTFRVQWEWPPEKTWRSHEGYTTWIDYFKKNWGKYNYSGTIDNDWHKRRKSYIAQQVELMAVFTHTRDSRNHC